MSNKSAVERFAALFAGYSKAHGVYRVKGRDERGKIMGHGQTVAGPAPFELHLSGDKMIGSLPLRDDDTVTWAAIDIDKYEPNLMKIVHERVTKLKLPLILCESKSKGVHAYYFLNEPTSAERVRNLLDSWAAKLGFGGCEVFPKQSYRYDESDVGNWINLPYFKSTERLCWNGQRSLTLDEFLFLCETSRVDPPVQLEELNDNQFKGAPPCICHYAETGGAPEGVRNNTVYELTVFCRKKWPDGWQAKVHELQALICNPPLPYSEVQDLIKGFNKKGTYDNRCNGPYCDKNGCKKREFGRGDQTQGAVCEIGGVVKLLGDPVFWIVEIEGQRVKMTTKQLQSQTEFNLRCMDALSRCPATLPQPKWLALVDSKIRLADVVTAPEEASPLGAFYEILDDYLSNSHQQATEIKDVLVGLPWKDEQSSKHVFRGKGLFDYLATRRFQYHSQHEIWLHLADLKAENKARHVDGKTIKVFELPFNWKKN